MLASADPSKLAVPVASPVRAIFRAVANLVAVEMLPCTSPMKVAAFTVPYVPENTPSVSVPSLKNSNVCVGGSNTNAAFLSPAL